jgi:hypothetical protein
MNLPQPINRDGHRANIFPTLSRASVHTGIVSAARPQFNGGRILQSLIATLAHGQIVQALRSQFSDQIFHAASGKIVAALLRQFSRDGIVAALMAQCAPKESRT